MTGKAGIYIHVPFCTQKCPYCDFYSLAGAEKLADRYTKKVLSALGAFYEKYPRKADTLYFGGGTPILLGGENISETIAASKKLFGLENAEITVEANPESVNSDVLGEIYRGGANRISMGLQSANDSELRLLGRQHTASRAAEAVALAKGAGFENISIDLMLGIPEQTVESALRSVDFCLGLDIPHISAYMLKIEENTPFARTAPELDIPDDELTADIYEAVSEKLRKEGYVRYEISNFARTGFESRHNLKYWNCDEYFGMGPSAHSFLGGKRYFYKNDLSAFLDMPDVTANEFESDGGDRNEYIMLRLRLEEGLSLAEFSRRFPDEPTEPLENAARELEFHGLVRINDDNISLSDRGVLVSNPVIASFLD